MTNEQQFTDRATGPEPPAGPPPRRTGRAGVAIVTLASVLLLGVSGLVAWQWLNQNLLHWGVEDGRTTTVHQAELIERIRAFELATVKHTYAGQARVDDSKRLAAGPVRLGLPNWVAGQQLDVTGEVRVTAGVDLSAVSPDDIEVQRTGKETRVLIRLPAPMVLSSELLPDTLDLSTHEGVLTRVSRRVGVNERDLRDIAADQVIASARGAAIDQGILSDAAVEAQRRLGAFLAMLPAADGRVTYVIEIRAPAVQ